MTEVTHILDAVQSGDSKAADRLLPLVYDELRRLAAYKMACEAPGHTLQPTALVHEAWLRLVGRENAHFEGRTHFFAAAAEAMRRILVENARRKRRLRHGGGQARAELEESKIAAPADDDKILLVSEALEGLEAEDPLQAQVVKLRFFTGLSNDEVATALGVSEKTVQRYWAHAKAWLFQHIRKQA
jgi:RNA polymerase sigma factor (TIGR02999 family)